MTYYPPTKCCGTCTKWQRDTAQGGRHVCTDNRAVKVRHQPPVKAEHEGKNCRWWDAVKPAQRRMF